MSKELIRLRDITMEFDGEKILDGINLYIKDHEFLTLLGPSGCGKTTMLRLLAGFGQADKGEIRINGEDITNVPPHQRPVNTVFQRYALFPHLNVFENIAFPLRLKKLPDTEIAQRVKELLELVALRGFESRHNLSYWQNQEYLHDPHYKLLVYLHRLYLHE